MHDLEFPKEVVTKPKEAEPEQKGKKDEEIDPKKKKKTLASFKRLRSRQASKGNLMTAIYSNVRKRPVFERAVYVVPYTATKMV